MENYKTKQLSCKHIMHKKTLTSFIRPITFKTPLKNSYWDTVLVTTSPGCVPGHCSSPQLLITEFMWRNYMAWYRVQVCVMDPNSRGGETVSITVSNRTQCNAQVVGLWPFEKEPFSQMKSIWRTAKSDLLWTNPSVELIRNGCWL